MLQFAWGEYAISKYVGLSPVLQSIDIYAGWKLVLTLPILAYLMFVLLSVSTFLTPRNLILGVNVEKTEAQVQAVSTTSLEALRSMGNIRALFSTSGTITPGYYSDLPQRNFGIFSQVMIGNNCIQEYYVPDSGIIYRRYWNNGSSTMLPWKKIVLASV